MLTFRGLLCCWASPPPRSLVFHRKTTATLFRAHRDMQPKDSRVNWLSYKIQQSCEQRSAAKYKFQQPLSVPAAPCFSPLFPVPLLSMSTLQAQTRTHISDEELQGGIGDGDPVVGARPPPQFVQDDQWAFGRPGDDLRGFGQLLHERTAAFVDVVRGSHPEDRDRQRQKVSNIHERRWTCGPFFFISHTGVERLSERGSKTESSSVIIIEHDDTTEPIADSQTTSSQKPNWFLHQFQVRSATCWRGYGWIIQVSKLSK